MSDEVSTHYHGDGCYPPHRNLEWDRTVEDAQDTALDVLRGDGWPFADPDDERAESMRNHPAGNRPMGAPTTVSEECEDNDA